MLEILPYSQDIDECALKINMTLEPILSTVSNEKEHYDNIEEDEEE